MSTSIFTSPFGEDVHITTVEMHTAGEPLRIVTSGFPEPTGATILDKLRYIKTHLDHYRKLLMLEPRGHYDMFGAILVEPDVEGADIAVVFIHNNGYCTMCGHGIIALGRYAVDNGLVKTVTSPETRVGIQCPCGLVEAFVEYSPSEKPGSGGGLTGAVRFHSVPAFVFATDIPVDVPGLGPVTVDVSYGGTYYALLTDADAGVPLKISRIQAVVDIADVIMSAVRKQVRLSHPDHEDLAFLFGTIITDGNDEYSTDTTSSIVVFADKQVDRAPCGSGVTSRIALQYHKGQIGLGQVRRFESGTTGSTFTGMAVKEVTCGKFKAVVVEVGGKAYYTGSNIFTLERGDRLGHGFLVR